MLIKTSELIGRALDWAVIKAIYPGADDSSFWLNFTQANRHSESWELSGSIIENTPRIAPSFDERFSTWLSYGQTPVKNGKQTFLVAAMRCYVASKLGDEVEVPNELA